MQKNVLFTMPLLLLAWIILGAFGGGENLDYPGGAPAGYTGSPGDGHNCTSCHNGSATTVSGWITSTIPAEGYTPGTNYTITVTLTGTGTKGFEVSPQNASGAVLGTLAAGTGSKLVGSGQYVTQTSAKTSNPAVWTFTWTAPAAGTGNVTFYGAFTLNKPVTKLSTLDVIEKTSLTASATATPGQVCMGDSSQLNAIAGGISGPYSYQWSSSPSGFSSTLQNPWVKPTVNTQYTVVITSGASTANASAQVNVTGLPTAMAGNDTICCVQVTQIPVNGSASNFSSVLWSTSGDGTFSNATSLNTAYTPGPADKTALSVNLTLQANAQSPCPGIAADSRHITLDPCSGVNTLSTSSANTSIFPNPSAGNFILNFSGTPGELTNITVFNVQGKMVEERNIPATGKTQSERFDLSGLSRGLYYIRLRTASSLQTQKLIIH